MHILDIHMNILIRLFLKNIEKLLFRYYMRSDINRRLFNFFCMIHREVAKLKSECLCRRHTFNIWEYAFQYLCSVFADNYCKNDIMNIFGDTAIGNVSALQSVRCQPGFIPENKTLMFECREIFNDTHVSREWIALDGRECTGQLV